MKRNFIFFDFDGVIADSFSPAFEVNKMICPGITEDDYRKRLEGNINEWWEKTTDEKHTDKCRHDIDFFKEYLPKMEKSTIVFPGMKDVIVKLANLYSLIIISSTTTNPIREFMIKNDMEKYFTEIMGNDVHKSKVEKIKMIFLKYKIDPKKCIFITDTLGDIREAEFTKVQTIGVSWGFHNKETLLKGKPFKIVDEPKDLILAVSDYFSNKIYS